MLMLMIISLSRDELPAAVFASRRFRFRRFHYWLPFSPQAIILRRFRAIVFDIAIFIRHYATDDCRRRDC
jgi:hypothetical protein